MTDEIISGRKLLTPDEEASLFRRMHAGDASARDELILCNMRLVAMQAYSLADRGMCFDDLMSEGTIGLMRAIDKFSPDKGTRLSTYAVPWIREVMLRAIAVSAGCLHVPVYVTERHVSIQKRQGALTQKLGRVPDASETAEACRGKVRGITDGRSVERIWEQISAGENAAALDAPAVDGGAPLQEIVPGNGEWRPDRECMERAVTEEIEAIMDECLSEREKLVIRLRFGFGVSRLGISRGTVVPSRKACRIIGTSVARVDQIRNGAVAKMRRYGADRLAVLAE